MDLTLNLINATVEIFLWLYTGSYRIQINRVNELVPLNIRQIYIHERLSLHYVKLQQMHLEIEINSRNKSIELPSVRNEIGRRAHEYAAVFYFNKL